MSLHQLILNNPEYIAIRDTILDNADVNSKDHDGDTPLHLIMLNNDENLIINVCSLLLKAGADVNVQNNDGDTPLHLAIMEDLDRTIIKSLLDSMANVHIQNNSHETPLTLVQEYASDDAVINLVLAAYNNVFNEPWFQYMQQYQLSNNLQDDEEIRCIMGDTLEVEQ